LSKKSGSSEDAKEMSRLLVALLQGFVFESDKKLWSTLLNHQQYVRDYFLQIGLSMHLHREDGFAFLSARKSNELAADSADDEGDADVSESRSLIRKIPLTYEVSLLCVLLRECLEQHDIQNTDDHRKIVTKNEIYEMLSLFFKDSSDEVKLRKKFDSHIQKVIDMGFVKPLTANEDRFEIRRTIKALINIESLRGIKEAMTGMRIGGAGFTPENLPKEML
jgi:hypothetical protein